MRIRFRFCWQAWYVGVFYSTRYRTLYVQIVPLLVPLLGLAITFSRRRISYDRELCPLDTFDHDQYGDQ